MAVILKDSYTNDNSFYEHSTNEWGSQTFTAGSSYTISAIALKLYRHVSYNSGTVKVSIRAVDGSSKPTGSDLATSSMASSGITTSSAGVWYTFTLSAGVSLTVGTEYAIVIEAETASAGNSLFIRIEYPTPLYAGGVYWYSGNGSTWVALGADAVFRTYTDAFVSPSEKTYSKKLIAIANNEVWYESVAGTMAELTAANGDIDTSNPLSAFEYDEKAFIVNDDVFRVVDFGNTKILTADIVGGGDPPDFHTVLTGGSSGAKMVVDFITSLTGACAVYGKRITTATFTSAETVTGVDDDGNAISFAMTAAAEVAPPHWYAWTPFGNDSSYGAMPLNGYVGCNYRGRPTITADKYYPHQMYQARQGNPWDWNWVANDAGTPIKGGFGDAAEVGDIILTAIPYKDDIMIYACANTLWYQVGDLAEGGAVVELSLTGGILGSTAFCWDDQDNLYIFATTGLLKIAKGFQSPQNLTRIVYPDFIKDIAYNASLHRISMAYDRDRHGIKIAKTTLADGVNSGWWYDLTTEGLFPESYNANNGMFSMIWYEAIDPAYRKLILGCFNGYLVYEDESFKDDDIGGSDAAIDSYYTTGPLALGGEGGEGILTGVQGIPTLDTDAGTTMDSDDVAYKVWVGESAARVTKLLKTNTSPRLSGTMSSTGYIRGTRKRRKLRGIYAGIRVGNDTAAETWGLEKLLVDSRPVGRLK